MPSITRDFSGNMDLDSHVFRVSPKNYIDALNITRNAQGTGNDGVVSNIVGNKSVAYTLPELGVNTTIGSFEDKRRNKIYDFTFNSEGYHFIAVYDRTTGVKSKIIQSKTDSNGTDILKFNISYRVMDVFVIHRDEDDGDILLFNDRINRPRAFNVNALLGIIAAGVPVPESYITFAKRPPLDAIYAVYQNDASVTANNLKKKLFQFKYRWVYEDGYKSTWSPWSKVKIPVDASTVDIESDPTKNNVMSIQVKGGGMGFTRVELAGRYSIGATFCDPFLIDSLGRFDYGITEGATYNYRFLNDGAYASLDQRESDLLYDNIPDLANAMALINGNHVGLAGVTDGYAQIARSAVNVQIGSSLIVTNASSSTPATPSIEWHSGISGGRQYVYFLIGASVAAGCTYNIKFHHPVYQGDDYYVDVTYTAIAGDTNAQVAEHLSSLIAAQMVGHPASCFYDSNFPNKVNCVNEQVAHAYAFDEIVTGTTALILKAGGSPTWLWNAKYRFGIVYFDEYGKTNGVVSFVSNTEDPNDFSVTTPNFAVSTIPGDNYQDPMIPVVNATINHAPPSWAVRYQWVRTANLSIDSFLHTMTCQVDKDDNNRYVYLCIANLDSFRLDNTGFVPSYTFKAGDRVRMMANFSTFPDAVKTYTQDYEVLGEVTRPINGSDTVSGRFLKIAYNGNTFGAKTLIQIYRPALRTAATREVFYEFGESYPIYIFNGTRYHVGQLQNQTSSQAATFQFKDGDVYYKFRDFYSNTLVPAGVYTQGVMDANYSDYFDSAVNSNGRPNVIDPNANRIYSPTQIRYGQAYQAGTDINAINRFYFEDFDEYDREFGDIMALTVRDRMLRVFQKFKVGRAPILQQMTFNQDGSSNLILSSNLINKIQYYEGNYGIGECPESLVSVKYSDYWYSNVTGSILRLSQDGIVSLSEMYGVNDFSVARSEGSAGKVIGAYDNRSNKYILSFAATATLPAKTIVWNEDKNHDKKGFETFWSLVPEWMGSLNNLFVSWNNGVLYTHDSTVYNRFFGVDYESSITVVLNDNPAMKKDFRKITLISEVVWDIPSFTTNTNSHGTTKQQTNVKVAEFDISEGEWHAALMRDSNSTGGKTQGTPLKGQYAIAKLRKQSASSYCFINLLICGDGSSSRQPNT